MFSTTEWTARLRWARGDPERAADLEADVERVLGMLKACCDTEDWVKSALNTRLGELRGQLAALRR